MVRKEGTGFSLPCPAQGFPVPSFRLVRQYVGACNMDADTRVPGEHICSEGLRFLVMKWI